MQFDTIELRDMVRFVSNIMGKNFVYDEALVKGQSHRALTEKPHEGRGFPGFRKRAELFGFTSWQRPRP